MFDRLKKTLSLPSFLGSAEPTQSGQLLPDSPIFKWASSRGYSYIGGQGESFTMIGKIAEKAWKLECGPTSRDYISGNELRARAELEINEDIAVMVMNRSLKQVLEKRAYQMYTDTLQTVVEPNMPEEMRWLSTYPEVGWSGAPPQLWERYAIQAEERSHAIAWLTPALVDLLLSLPLTSSNGQLPFILMLLRGKAYLRTQYTSANLETLDHTALIFTAACESALGSLSLDIPV